jgi:soluble lytic murein transglycosylase-like protein
MLSKIAFRGICGSQKNADKSPRWSKFGVRLILTSVMVLTLPGAGTTTVSASEAPKPVQTVVVVAPAAKPRNTVPPAVRSMDGFLKSHKVSEENRARLAKALVASAKKYDLNPRLLASVMIVESRGNQFAVSGADAVGLMQIHLPTWGETVDRENINLFKIEDNIDFGARILKDYVRRFGMWDGVKRYNGLVPGDPVWEESAAAYLAKVQEVYEFRPATT